MHLVSFGQGMPLGRWPKEGEEEEEQNGLITNRETLGVTISTMTVPLTPSTKIVHLVEYCCTEGPLNVLNGPHL